MAAPRGVGARLAGKSQEYCEFLGADNHTVKEIREVRAQGDGQITPRSQ